VDALSQLRPLRIGEILDVCINIFTKNFLTFLKIILVVVVPVQVVTVVIQVATVSDPDLLPTLGSSGGGRVASDDVDAYIGGQVVILVLSLVLYAIATAACFMAVGDAYLGSRPNWRTSLAFAARRFHSVLWVTLLVGIASTFALILLIAPGIWLWFSYSVAVPALLFEGCKGTNALSRSYRLVKGRWWATAGAILSAYLIATVIGGILQGLISALVFTDAGDSVFGVAVIDAVANGIGQLFTTAFPAAVTAVVYYDLRVRKEGFDLQLLAERLGVAPAGNGNGNGAAFAPPPMQASVPVWERQPQAPPPPPPPPPPTGE
jgi:hypothetical protein